MYNNKNSCTTTMICFSDQDSESLKERLLKFYFAKLWRTYNYVCRQLMSPK